MFAVLDAMMTGNAADSDLLLRIRVASVLL